MFSRLYIAPCYSVWILGRLLDPVEKLLGGSGHIGVAVVLGSADGILELEVPQPRAVFVFAATVASFRHALLERPELYLLQGNDSIGRVVSAVCINSANVDPAVFRADPHL